MTDANPGESSTMSQSPILSDQYSRALDYARVVHGAQVRKKTKIPYLAHVMAASVLVLEHGGSEDQAIAALLHDSAEDHGGEARLRAVAIEFGERVAAMVRFCSDSLVEDPAKKPDWWSRKVRYLEHIAEADPNEQALIVCASDKLHNARAIDADYREHSEALWGRFSTGRQGSLWYYRRLAELLAAKLTAIGGDQGRLGQHLQETVEGLRRRVGEQVPISELEQEYENAIVREREVRTALDALPKKTVTNEVLDDN